MKRNRLISMTGALLAAVFSNITSANNEFLCSTQGLVQPNEYNAVFLFDNQQSNSSLRLGGYFQGILDAGGLNGDYTVADVAEPFTVLNRPSITLAPLTTQQVLESKPLAVTYIPQSPLSGTGVCADVEVTHRVFEDTTTGVPLNTYAISIFKQYHSPDNGCFYVHDYWAQMADPALTLDQRRDIVTTFIYGDSSTPGQFLYRGQLFDSLITSSDPSFPFETAFRVNRSIDSFVSDQLVVPYETLVVPTVQGGSWTLTDRAYDLGFGPQVGDLIFGVGSLFGFSYQFAFDTLFPSIIRFGVDTAYTAPTDERILTLITGIFSGTESTATQAHSALKSFYCLAEAPPIIPAPEPPVTPNFTGLEPVSSTVRYRRNLNRKPNFTLVGPDAATFSATEATPLLGVPTINGRQLGLAMATPMVADAGTGLLTSEITFEEWDYFDNWHKNEDVSGMVLPLGIGFQTEADGTQWVTGKVEIDPDTLPGTSVTVTFSDAFSSTPLIFTQVHHYGRNCETVAPRTSNIDAAQFTLHYEDYNPEDIVSQFNRDKNRCTNGGENRGPNGGVEISYLAIAPGEQATLYSSTLNYLDNRAINTTSVGSTTVIEATMTLGGVERLIELASFDMGVSTSQSLNFPGWDTRLHLTHADFGLRRGVRGPRTLKRKMWFSAVHGYDQTVALLRFLPSQTDSASHVFGAVQTYNGGVSGGALTLRREAL